MSCCFEERVESLDKMDVEPVELSRQESRLNCLPAIWSHEKPAFPNAVYRRHSSV